MKTIIRKLGKARLSLSIPLLIALVLTACGSSFEEGTYATPGSGATYEFGPDGQGRLVGAVSGTPTFTYKVESDRVVVSYGKGQPEAVFKRIDKKTLERHDGAQLILRE